MNQLHLQIEDKLIAELVTRKRDLTVLNYYGDRMCAQTVSSSNQGSAGVAGCSGRPHDSTTRMELIALIDSLPGGCCMAPI